MTSREQSDEVCLICKLPILSHTYLQHKKCLFAILRDDRFTNKNKITIFSKNIKEKNVMN